MKTSFRFLFVAVGFVFLVLSGCGWIFPDPEPDPIMLQPDINLRVEDRALPSGGIYDFGKVAVGTSSTATFVVENVGEGVLKLETGTLIITVRGVGDLSYFMMTNPAATSIQPNDSTTFFVSFAPETEGFFSMELSLVSNDPDDGNYAFVVRGGNAEPEPEPYSGPWALPDGFYYTRKMDSDESGNLYVQGVLEGEQSLFVMKFDSSGAVVWKNEMNVSPASAMAYGLVVSTDGTAVYRGYLLRIDIITAEPHVERLDSATGERVWDVLSSNPAFLALDPTDSRLYVLSYMGDGRRYDTADGSVLGEWGGTERNVDSVATDGSYFYYSGRVYSPSADWPVWVRRSYDLETYEWFWNPWEEGFVNEPPQGGKMVLGNGMLYGATNEGVNCYSTAEGDRLWFLPVNLMEGMQYTYQYTGVAAGDGTAAYVLYRAVRYSSSSLLEIVEKRNRLLKISGGEVVWGTEVGNLNDAVAAVVHATRDTIFVAISEGDRVKRFSTLDGSEF